MSADLASSDLPPAGAPGAPTQGVQAQAPLAQAPQPQVPLVVLAQYLKDLSFENPGASPSQTPAQAPLANAGAEANAQPSPLMPQGRVDVDVRARPIAETTFEVSLVLRAEARRQDQLAFLIEIEYAGLFQLNNVPREAVEPLLLIECPRLLLPFARSIVAQATQDGGYAPLLVNPIDFAALYRAQRQRQAQAPAQTPAGSAD